MTAEWLAAARADLARIFAFNASRNADHAERVDARLLERADALARNPAMGRPLGQGGLRTLSVVDIQYVILYALVEGQVTIFRVYHTREDRKAL